MFGFIIESYNHKGRKNKTTLNRVRGDKFTAIFCGYNRNKNTDKTCMVMHQSFVTTSQAPGNSGDFDFSFSKSLLKAPHSGGSQLVKLLPCSPLSFPTQSVMFTLHCHLCVRNANPWYFPGTAGTQKHSAFPRLSPALFQVWAGPWLNIMHDVM